MHAERLVYIKGEGQNDENFQIKQEIHKKKKKKNLPP